MKYKINKTNYCTFEIFQDNRLKARSYFIPYPNRKEADLVSIKDKRYHSPKVACLNGIWDFKFYPRPKELPDILDTDKIVFDKLEVPSCWQFKGYSRPFYVNARYQFPFNPPHIPQEDNVDKCFSWIGTDQKLSLRRIKPKDEYNFVGVYRHNFKTFYNDKRYILSFLGVASCLDLYINGEYVGYSEGSHNTAEFDITKYLNDRDNEMLVVVHRWCNGSYLEDQDMFRNNGIFRDVLLRMEDESDIFDISAKTIKENGRYSLTLKAETYQQEDVIFTLLGNNIDLSKKATPNNGIAEVIFTDLDVLEWSAENPILYDIYFETRTCTIKEKIGFKDIKIRGDLFYLNDKFIKFKGVNHHDTSCVNGYTLTPDEIEKDILLCKEFNIDTIRTSHYPPDPLLIELADYYGIYIIDENDLETHGVWANHLPITYNILSHSPKWEKHYMDRIIHLYQRDKIHENTSIIMWSLGNESGGYYNTDKMYEYLKEQSRVPVHYEGVIHSKRIAYDIASEMYPSPSNVELVGKHSRKQKQLNDRPYFLCEYAHAMGVGPGNIESYWDVIYRYNNLIGGCIWEMIDHAVLHHDGSYTYGGDHGEWEHDSNFCVDGMFYPNRTPSTGAYIAKFAYRPIRVSHIKDNIFEVFNTLAFTNAKEYSLEFVFNDGKKVNYHFDVKPLSKDRFDIDMGKEVDGNLSVIIIVKDSKGIIRSEEQITIKEHINDIDKTILLPDYISIKNGQINIKLKDGSLLKSNEEYNLLYRAPTDNDADLRFKNAMDPYKGQVETFISQSVIPNGIKVERKIKNKKGTFHITDTYEGSEQGIIVTSTLHKSKKTVSIPRFGKCFYLDKDFDDVIYLAREKESYIDMKEQSVIKECHKKVLEMTEPNIKPQESGNRTDARYVCLSNNKTKVSFIALNKPFEFGVKPYSDRALLDMKHQKDEIRTGTYICIEAFQQGIGTGSCGPLTAEEFKYYSDKDYTYKFLIKVE